MICLIAAIDLKRGIATDDGIPWDIPQDKQYFREKTINNPVLMGAGVYNEFSEPLPNRENFVLTNSQDPLRDGFVKVTDLSMFISDHNQDTLWIIGGAQIYAQTIEIADELYLTQIDRDFHCTKFFPSYEQDFYRAELGAKANYNNLTFRFEIWKKK